MTHNGVSGHLAKITSADENAFTVDELLDAVASGVFAYFGGFRVGGSVNVVTDKWKDSHWEWVTGEA